MMHFTVILLVVYTQLINDGVRAAPNCTFTCRNRSGFDATTAVEIDKCLHWSRERKTFTQAMYSCAINEGKLFLAKTRNLFFRVLAYATESRRNYWLGLQDWIRDCDFVWIDGTTLSRDLINYEKYWVKRERANDSNNTDCVVLRYDQWGLDDDDCSNMWHYVCETRN